MQMAHSRFLLAGNNIPTLNFCDSSAFTGL
jgi:hypothetical protein